MQYKIEVIRGEKSGVLKFQSGGVSVSTTCWWDPKVRIDSGTYKGCSATWMANKTDGRTVPPWGKPGQKRREAIFLGKGVPVNGRTSDDIFIHRGVDASWSDGCIVALKDEIWKIWDAIKEKDARNVTVIVRENIVTTPPAIDSSLPGVPRSRFHRFC